jgi:hypothetical protein
MRRSQRKVESQICTDICINYYQNSVFRVSATIFPSLSSLAVRYHALFDLGYFGYYFYVTKNKHNGTKIVISKAQIMFWS